MRAKEKHRELKKKQKRSNRKAIHREARRLARLMRARVAGPK